jgi:hypothetical protein
MPKKCRDSNPPLEGDLYAGGTYSEGGTYMPVYTVVPPKVKVFLRLCWPGRAVDFIP